MDRQVSWGRAVGLSAIMILASYLVFILIPNNLLGYLATRTVPFTRDLLVTLWWMAGFVFCCWLFVRLQRSPER